MFIHFINHEIRSLLKSHRVIWALTVFSVLFFLIFFLRVENLRLSINQYIKNIEVTENALERAVNYSFLNPRAILKPKPFSVYNEGFTSEYGNVINTRFFEPILKPEVLNTESNDFFNDSVRMDITFLVTFFLSLFIFLISYDSVNSEKQTGTLRVLLTWDFKKALFLYKKIFGIFIFVFFVFSLPYLLSGLYLLITFGDFIGKSFFLSFSLYWISVMLFIFLMSIFGVFTSLISYKPNKSLVYALSIWLFMTVILPVGWDYLISENINKNRLSTHINNYREIDNEMANILKNLPDEANPDKVGHYSWNGGYHYNVTVTGHRWTNEVRRNYIKYINDNYYPELKKLENENLQIMLLRNNRENLKSMFMFFNPVIVFRNLVNISSGNSQNDYYNFILDAIDIRDSLIMQGIREDWLLTNRFFSQLHPDYEIPFWMDYVTDENKQYTEEDWLNFMQYSRQVASSIPPNNFTRPEIKRYSQRELLISELSNETYKYFLILAFSIILLLLISNKLFLKYDVR